MNILGRLVGGLLILIGLGWLASTAGLPPFGTQRTANRTANQLGNNQNQGLLKTTPTATNSFTTQQKVTQTTTTAPAAGTNGAGAAKTTTTTTSTAPVEASPRDAAAPLNTQPTQTQPTTTTVVVEKPAAPAAVPAGW